MKRLRAVGLALPLFLLAQCGNVHSGCAPTPATPPPVAAGTTYQANPQSHMLTPVPDTSAEQIGTSVQGRPIMAYKVGDGGPAIVIVAQIHGNEDAPAIVAQAAREHAWAGNTVYVIPTLNVDGAAAHVRTNANGVDLNREGAPGQPEGQALISFVQRVQPVLTVHVHDPSNYTGYYGNAQAQSIAQALASAMGTGYRGLVANHTFLWNYTSPAVIVEVPAISASDCAGCSDNRTQSTPEHVRAMADAMMATLDANI